MYTSSEYCDELTKIFGDLLYNVDVNGWIITNIEIKDGTVEADCVDKDRKLIKKLYKLVV